MNGAYNAEMQLQKPLLKCVSSVHAGVLKNELRRYVDLSQDKIIKLEDAFSLLLQKPYIERNDIAAAMINETTAVLQHTTTPHLRDVFIIDALQRINHYKIAAYGTARAIAEALKLAMVPDIIGQMLEWEKETDRRLTWLAVERVNKQATVSPLLIENKMSGHEELVPA